MNLDNPSNTVALRALIARAAGVADGVAADVVAALHAEGYGVAHAPCPDCRDVHPSYPTIRAYHSPVCATRKRGACASCGGSLGQPAVLVGSLCDRCAYGEPCV